MHSKKETTGILDIDTRGIKKAILSVFQKQKNFKILQIKFCNDLDILEKFVTNADINRVIALMH